MREIKFRGYSIDDKCWVTGYGVEKITEDAFFIPTGCANDTYKVFKESIGEYTGLKDKNGVEIYEGDIIKRPSFEYFDELFIGSYCEVDELYGAIELNNYAWCVMQKHKYVGYKPYLLSVEQELGRLENIEVIGNIYENPELLEG